VYTRSSINKNTRIIEYAGERISMAESVKRERPHLKAGLIWCFAVSRRVVVDASVGGNLARFINHACRPNCYSRIVKGKIWICAGRHIKPGEELTYNYYSNGAAGLRCRCRPGCRTLL
jgi:SET domain-containing protein